MRVKSLVTLEAEGHVFPAGTVFEVEQTYAATHDLLHVETDALLWALKTEVELVEASDA